MLAYGRQQTFTAGVTLLYGHRNSAKTWLAYEACRQELAKGNGALIIDYELSRAEALGAHVHP